MGENTSGGNRLDKKVILSMGGLALVAVIIFGFRFIATPPCRPLHINILGSNNIDSLHFYTGMPLRFSYNANKDDQVEWSFGTRDEKKSEGQMVTFSYNDPGQYLVGLTVNGRCNEYQFISISKAPKLIDPNLIPKIICNVQNIEVGQSVEFKDSTPAAKSWEWRFGESNDVDATGPTASHIFNSVGSKTVTLTINGNPDAFATYQIYVNEKAAPHPKPSGDIVIGPIKDKPAEAKVVFDLQKFTDLLNEVAKGHIMASDCASYLCNGNLQTPVKYKVSGEKEQQVSFEMVCRDLEKMKWRKIIKISVDPPQLNQLTGCIESLSITVKKKTGIF